MIRKTQIQVGAAAIAFAVFLAAVGIPYGVSSPSNVPKLVLSPLFWPYVLAGLLAIAGVGLLLSSAETAPFSDTESAPVQGGAMRLAAMAVLMIAYVMAMPVIGLVWASVIVFAAVAFLIRTSHPKSALIAAVVVPLLLYAFFAHVAGVAIPQGEFVRLP